MVRLWGIPRAVGEWVRDLFDGGLVDALWIIFVTLLLFAAVVFLSLFSIVGAAVAGIILTFVLQDEIRAFVSDTYERRWVRVSLSGLWPFVVVLAAVATLTAGTAVVHAATVTLSADHLGDERTIQTYHDEGQVSTHFQRVNGQLTIAQSADTVGLESFKWTDVDTTYLRVQYNESIERTLRVEIPDAYFHPRPKSGLEAASGDATADLRRDPDGDGTIVSIDVTGPTTAVFPISKEAGIVFGVRGEIRETVANQTGVTVPTVSSAGEWTYINSSLQPQSTYRIAHPDRPGELAVQYDSLNGSEESRWVPAAPCNTEDTDICTLDRASNDTVTTILVDSASPPPVRYQVEPGLVTQVRGAMADIADIPSRIEAALGSLSESLPFF